VHELQRRAIFLEDHRQPLFVARRAGARIQAEQAEHLRVPDRPRVSRSCTTADAHRARCKTEPAAISLARRSARLRNVMSSATPITRAARAPSPDRTAAREQPDLAAVGARDAEFRVDELGRARQQMPLRLEHARSSGCTMATSSRQFGAVGCSAHPKRERLARPVRVLLVEFAFENADRRPSGREI